LARSRRSSQKAKASARGEQLGAGRAVNSSWFSQNPEVDADPVLKDAIPTSLRLSSDGGVSLTPPIINARLGLVATLADGSLALGGSGVVQSSAPQVLTVAAGYIEAKHWWPYLDLKPIGVGMATVSGNLGIATVSFPIEVTE